MEDGIQRHFDLVDRRFDSIEHHFDLLERRLERMQGAVIKFGVVMYILIFATCISVLATA